jgi:hypothetical protein
MKDKVSFVFLANFLFGKGVTPRLCPGRAEIDVRQVYRFSIGIHLVRERLYGNICRVEM